MRTEHLHKHVLVMIEQGYVVVEQEHLKSHVLVTTEQGHVTVELGHLKVLVVGIPVTVREEHLLVLVVVILLHVVVRTGHLLPHVVDWKIYAIVELGQLRLHVIVMQTVLHVPVELEGENVTTGNATVKQYLHVGVNPKKFVGVME